MHCQCNANADADANAMSKALAFNSALVNQLVKPMVIRPIAWDERVAFTIDYQFPIIFLRRRRIDLLLT